MTHDAAKQFWRDYIKLAHSKGTHLTMPNPADTFCAQAYIGTFSEMSDAEYNEKLKDAKDLASFWNHSHTETARNVLLNALGETDISDVDIDDIAGILADASVRSDYQAEDPAKKECNKGIDSKDRGLMYMDITPKQLADRLRQTIIGQDEWLDTLCTSAWTHNLRYQHFLNTGEVISQPKTNILCLGQSGTGKTLAIQTLAKILDLPIVIEDASALRGAGWRGTSVSSIVVHALEAAGDDDAKARHTIVVLDEFDKIFRSQATDPNFYPLNNLLTFIGGSIVNHSDNNKTCSLDTSSMLFICLGAFSGLEEIIQKRLSGETTIGFGASGYTEAPKENLFRQVTKEDLHEYGISWEFLGRIPLVTSTNELKATDYKRILTDSLASPIQQYDMLFNSLGVHVGISDAAADHIAQQASSSQMGARGLSQIVTELLTPSIYSVGNDNSITGIVLDIGPDGLFASNQKGQRPVPSQNEPPIRRQDGGPSLLSEIDIDILQSVPFSCASDKDNILECCLNIQDASENVKWRPISQIHPKPLLKSAMCILAASICTLLSNTDDQNPTMYDLFKTTDKISLAMVALDDSDQPLDLLRKGFINKALENSFDLSKTTQIAKHMIKQYSHKYVYDLKYSKR